MSGGSFRLEFATDEELAELQMLIDSGKFVSTRHPSEEEMAKVNEYWAGRDNAKEAEEAERLAEEARKRHGS